MKTVASEDAWQRGVSICIREIANCVSSHLACESGKNTECPAVVPTRKKEAMCTIICVELT